MRAGQGPHCSPHIPFRYPWSRCTAYVAYLPRLKLVIARCSLNAMGGKPRPTCSRTPMCTQMPVNATLFSQEVFRLLTRTHAHAHTRSHFSDHDLAWKVEFNSVCSDQRRLLRERHRILRSASLCEMPCISCTSLLAQRAWLPLLCWPHSPAALMVATSLAPPLVRMAFSIVVGPTGRRRPNRSLQPSTLRL